ncbi:MAG: AMP-binding protein [Gammaproteobacteria bacterium]|nr:AMP-binding protein [Gammaproteobacteria bacterium]
MHADFTWDIPAQFNIADWAIDRHQDVDSTAIYHETYGGTERHYTFAELHRLANKWANVLLGLGVVAGDRVAIVLPQRPETAIAHLGAYKIGAVALPLAVLFGPEALEYRLRDSSAKLVITDHAHAGMIETIKEQLPSLKRIVQCDADAAGLNFWQLLEKSSDGFKTLRTEADDPALLIYTSGTAGPPKGALIPHRALIGNLTGFEMSQNFFPQSNDIFWSPADWAWTGGLLDALLPSLVYGRPIVAYHGGKFDPERGLQLCQKYHVTNAFIPPTALKIIRQIRNIPDKFDLKLRAIMSAGEQVGEELIDWGKQALGVEINEMWGQTEFNYIVGNCSAIMPVRPGSMGRPYPGHHVAPIDDAGAVVPVGESGELAARIAGDPVMFLGYWKDDEATQSKIIGDWFRTGDIGYRDEDGFLWFVGRNDDVISSAGFRIGPGEVEDSLLKHPAVVQAAVIGKPDEMRGELVKAFVVLAEDVKPSAKLRREIQEAVKQRLSAHEYPRELEFVDELPMTTTGKVRRVELREQEAAGRQSEE